jgi:hypothetical protein
MSDPIYNFVSVWTEDDTRPPARPPVVSSDLYATPGLVLSAISTVRRNSFTKTTNVTSQDCFLNAIIPLADINTSGIGITTNFEYVVPAATGPYVAPGGVFFVSTVSTVVAAALNTTILPA